MPLVRRKEVIVYHTENVFIGNECYIDGKHGLSAIFRCNHSWDRSTFACAVPFFLYPCHRTLPPCCQSYSDFRDPFAQLVNCHMLILKHFLFLLHFCNCFGRPERCSSWMSAHPYINSLNHFRRFLTFIHCGPYTLHNWWWVSMGVVPLALKKWITAHISHLAGVARGSSIANSSTVKAECRNWLCSLGIWRGGA